MWRSFGSRDLTDIDRETRREVEPWLAIQIRRVVLFGSISRSKTSGSSMSATVCFGVGNVTLRFVGDRSNSCAASLGFGRDMLPASGITAFRVQIASLLTLTTTTSGAPNWNSPL